MGNDLNDMECLLFAAISAAPCDAEHAILDKVKWKSSKYGGNGAVREFCDFLINNNLI